MDMEIFIQIPKKIKLENIFGNSPNIYENELIFVVCIRINIKMLSRRSILHFVSFNICIIPFQNVKQIT